jgi:tetratricopeptide (TPR) repeat protein
VYEYNQTQYAKELAWTYHDVGASINSQNNEKSKGLRFFKKALKIYETNNLVNLPAYQLTLSALQYIYTERGNFESLEYIAKKLLEYHDNKDENITWDKAYQNYIIGYSKVWQQKINALYYLDKALKMLKITKEKNKNCQNLIPYVINSKIQFYLNINIFENTQQYKDGIKFLKKVLKDFNLDDFNRYEIYTKIGDFEEKIGQIKSSKSSYKKAIKLVKKNIQQIKKEKEEKIVIELEQKKLSELQRCIKANSSCKRQEYIICESTDENNQTNTEIVVEKECENEPVEEECTNSSDVIIIDENDTQNDVLRKLGFEVGDDD